MPSRLATARAEDERAPAPAIDLAAELLRRGRPVTVVVGGESMWPLVRSGERVRIEPAIAPRRGLLGAVLLGGHLVVHRIVAMNDSWCTLLGDLGGSPARIPQTDLLGVVVELETRGGRKLRLDRGARRFLGVAVSLVTPVARWPWRWTRALRARVSAARSATARAARRG